MGQEPQGTKTPGYKYPISWCPMKLFVLQLLSNGHFVPWYLFIFFYQWGFFPMKPFCYVFFFSSGTFLPYGLLSHGVLSYIFCTMKLFLPDEFCQTGLSSNEAFLKCLSNGFCRKRLLSIGTFVRALLSHGAFVFLGFCSTEPSFLSHGTFTDQAFFPYLCTTENIKGRVFFKRSPIKSASLHLQI